jgi:hypothetical protein
MQAITNAPYPNRIQLTCSPYVGPFVQDGSPPVPFDPARDLEFYVDGVLQPVQSSYFDAVNNRYLVYMSGTFNLQGFIQVIYHIPNPPFVDANSSMLGGFATVASYVPSSDVVTNPLMVLSANPTEVFPFTPYAYLLWITEGVPMVGITGTNGLHVGPMGPSGVYTMLSTWSSFSGIITLTLTGYNSYPSDPILVGSPPEPLTTTATIFVNSLNYLLLEDSTELWLEDGTPIFLES